MILLYVTSSDNEGHWWLWFVCLFVADLKFKSSVQLSSRSYYKRIQSTSMARRLITYWSTILNQSMNLCTRVQDHWHLSLWLCLELTPFSFIYHNDKDWPSIVIENGEHICVLEYNSNVRLYFIWPLHTHQVQVHISFILLFNWIIGKYIRLRGSIMADQ